MSTHTRTRQIQLIGILCAGIALGAGLYVFVLDDLSSTSYTSGHVALGEGSNAEPITMHLAEPLHPPWPAPLDTAEYDARLLALAHYTPPEPVIGTTTRADGTIATTTKVVSDLIHATGTNVTVQGERWPATAPYPNGGAILPFKRILAFYGNFYSTRMGILGEYEPEVVLSKLRNVAAEWEAADPTTPIQPALQYIAMVAQGSAGSDGMWRSVMPESEIEKGYVLAQEAGAIYILDLQVGLSTIQRELPKFRKYLERPDVHLGIDPEFSMKTGKPPGTVVGTYDAADINWVIDYLAEIVHEQKLPPKVLVVHRFTQAMVTNATSIQPRPEVQVVMHMDGWGSKERKRDTYDHIVAPEPVQFMGIKIFYKNDLKPPSTGLLTPEEVLDLDPKPIYVQYQ